MERSSKGEEDIITNIVLNSGAMASSAASLSEALGITMMVFMIIFALLVYKGRILLSFREFILSLFWLCLFSFIIGGLLYIRFLKTIYRILFIFIIILVLLAYKLSSGGFILSLFWLYLLSVFMGFLLYVLFSIPKTIPRNLPTNITPKMFFIYFISFGLIVFSQSPHLFHFSTSKSTNLILIGVFLFFTVSFIHLALALKSRKILGGEDHKVLMYYLLIPYFSGLLRKRDLLVFLMYYIPYFSGFLKKKDFNRKKHFVKAILLYFSTMLVLSTVLSFPVVFILSVLGYLPLNTVAILNVETEVSFFGFVSILTNFIFLSSLIGQYLSDITTNLSILKLIIRMEGDNSVEESSYENLSRFIRDVYCSLYAPDLYNANDNWVDKYSSYLFLFLLGDIYLSLRHYYTNECKNIKSQKKSEKKLLTKIAFFVAFYEFIKLVLNLPEWIIEDKRLTTCLIKYFREQEFQGNPGSVLVLEDNQRLIFQDLNSIKVKYIITTKKEKT